MSRPSGGTKVTETAAGGPYGSGRDGEADGEERSPPVGDRRTETGKEPTR
jgi:hypothetical protein